MTIPISTLRAAAGDVLDQLDDRARALAVLGLLLPAVTVVQPVQPVRALTAACVLLVLPGAGLALRAGLRDPLLAVVIAVAASLACTVVTSTALMYLGIWSWQLCLVLLGLFTTTLAVTTSPRGAHR